MRPTPIKHFVELEMTNDDTEVTMACNCGWVRTVSSTVPLIDLIRIVRQHRKPVTRHLRSIGA